MTQVSKMRYKRWWVGSFLVFVGLAFLSVYYLVGGLQSTTFSPVKNTADDDKCLEPVWIPESLNDIYSFPVPSCPAGLVLLILVTSAPPHRPRRRAIRVTWGRGAEGRWRTVFLVGREPKVDQDWIEREMDQEAETEGDLLRGNYIDSYRNLTLKVIHGFNFASTFCPSLFILKTDDDCFVQTTTLLSFLSSLPPDQATEVYAGRRVSDTTVIRNPHSRWQVPFEQYPPSRYAPYASGTGYIISRDVLERLVRLFPCVHPFPNEDAFIGTVIGQRLHVTLTASDRFTPFSRGWTPCNLLYLFVLHDVPAHLQNKYYREARSAYYICREATTEDLLWHQVVPEKKVRPKRSETT